MNADPTGKLTTRMNGRIVVFLVFVSILLAAYGFGLFDPPAAHLASMVPGDTRFAVVSSSLNDLRTAFEGPYADKKSDAAQVRYGTPINLPGLDGIDYDRPLGYYVRDNSSPVYLVPFTDLGAMEDAHETARENINAHAPVRVAKRYVSVADDDSVATIGSDDPWILEACQHPLALVAKPANAVHLRGMLMTFFGHDKMPLVRKALPAAAMFSRLPSVLAQPLAEELPTFRLALMQRDSGSPSTRFDLRAKVRASGVIEGAQNSGVDPAALLADFPASGEMTTIVGLAAAGEHWTKFGAPFDPGPAAGAFAIVSLKYRAGRNNVVFALQPADPARLDGLRGAPANALGGVIDGTPMRSWAMPEPPSALAAILRDSGNDAAPLHACEAIVAGRWFLTIGSHAEEVMRAMIRRATKASPRTLRNLAGEKTLGVKGSGSVAVVREHEQFFAPGKIALGFILGEAQKALQHPLPYIPMGSIGQPRAITFTVEVVDGWIRGDFRCFIADGR
jgi:hypothetical protein